MARKKSRRQRARAARAASSAPATQAPPQPEPSTPGPRPGGRPSELTDAVADTIVEAIRDGVPKHRAARLAGIDPSTLYRWLARGEQEETGKFCEFRDRVLRASDELVQEAVQVQRKLLSHSNPSVRQRASKFILAHMFSGEFSTKTQVETTGKDGAPIAVAAKVEGQVEVTVEGGVTAVPAFTAAQLAAMSLEQLNALGLGLQGLGLQDNVNRKEG